MEYLGLKGWFPKSYTNTPGKEMVGFVVEVVEIVEVVVALEIDHDCYCCCCCCCSFLRVREVEAGWQRVDSEFYLNCY